MTTSPDRIEEYLTLYRENKTYEQVGKVFGLSGKTIHGILARAGKLESRSAGSPKISPERIEEYLDLYRKGKSYRQIGKIFCLSWHSIYGALKNAGRLESRSKGKTKT